MLYSTFIILVLTFAVSLLLTKDFFHPSSIVSALWMFLVGMYIYCDHPLWELSDKFSKCLLLWVIPFCLVAYFAGRQSYKVEFCSIDYPFNYRRFSFIYKLFIIYIIVFVLAIYSQVGLSFSAIRDIMIQDKLPSVISLLLYASSLFLIFLFYALYHSEKIPRRKLVIIILGTLLVILFKSNKTSILSLFVSIIYILKIKEKLSLKLAITFVFVLAIMLVVITLNRADFNFKNNNAFTTFIYIYFLSPLTAFDALINGEVVLDQGAPWSSTLAFFYKILNALGANFDLAERGFYINVPLPTNVFTTMRAFYLDGGMWGLFLMSVISGCLYAFYYSLQKKRHIVFILFYAAIYSGLFFQHFGDYFFYTLSMIIQYFIFSVFMVRGVKIGRFKI